MAVPLFMLGRDYTEVKITPLSVNEADGVLTAQTSNARGLLVSGGAANAHTVSFCVVDDFDFQKSRNCENISGVNSTQANHVPIGESVSFSIREIVRRGTGGNFLAVAYYNDNRSRYALVSFARAHKIWTVYVTMQSLNVRIAKGKNVASLNCATLDAGVSTSAAYTTGVRS